MESSGWKRAKRWVDLIAGLSVIATMGFVALQWYEMHSGGIDTHDLAVAAKAQADAAKSQADDTKTIAESAKSQANNTEKLALASKSAADTAASALGETQREFRTGERPYLTPTPRGGFELPNGVHLVVHNDEKGNIKLSIEIVMTNSGKSPAIEVRATHSDYIIGLRRKWHKPPLIMFRSMILETLAQLSPPILALSLRARTVPSLRDCSTLSIKVGGKCMLSEEFAIVIFSILGSSRMKLLIAFE